jgi:hypothetical protein
MAELGGQPGVRVMQQHLEHQDENDRLEAFARRCKLLGQAWRGLPLPLRIVIGGPMILAVLELYHLAGFNLPPITGWV